MAERLGLTPPELAVTTMGGNSPQTLVNTTALDILRGDVDLAILGVPLDLATTGRSGAREGPNAVRTESAKLSELANHPHGFDPIARQIDATRRRMER